MEQRGMMVIMEDGFRIYFSKENDKVIVSYIKGNEFYTNEVSEDSIHAIEGEPLTFLYYYGSGNSQKAKTKAPVKEINYVW